MFDGYVISVEEIVSIIPAPVWTCKHTGEFAVKASARLKVVALLSSLENF